MSSMRTLSWALVLCSLGCSASTDDQLDTDGGLDASSVRADAAAGDGDRDSGAPAQHDAAAPHDAGAADAAAPADAGPSDASVAAIQAPMIDVVRPLRPDAGMAGVHLGWDLQGQSCDQIVGERKDALDPYTTWFTVPGTSTSYDDTTPMAVGTNYTYRIRCKKGSSFSPYSNEVSAGAFN
jgi:hypothetical protein